MAIGGCFINGYWWLFYCKPLVVILLLAIDGYCWLLVVIFCYITTIGGYYIISYCWLFYVILRLLVIIQL